MIRVPEHLNTCPLRWVSRQSGRIRGTQGAPRYTPRSRADPSRSSACVQVIHDTSSLICGAEFRLASEFVSVLIELLDPDLGLKKETLNF